MANTELEVERRRVSEAQSVSPITQLEHLATQINEAYEVWKSSAKQTLKHAMVMGDMLNLAFGHIGYQDRSRWLKRYCPKIAPRTARGYVQLARQRAAIERLMVEDEDLIIQDALKSLPKPPKGSQPIVGEKTEKLTDCGKKDIPRVGKTALPAVSQPLEQEAQATAHSTEASVPDQKLKEELNEEVEYLLDMNTKLQKQVAGLKRQLQDKSTNEYRSLMEQNADLNRKVAQPQCELEDTETAEESPQWYGDLKTYLIMIKQWDNLAADVKEWVRAGRPPAEEYEGTQDD